MSIVDDAISKLNGLFANSTEIQKFFQASLSAMAESETAIEYLLNNRSLEDSTGVWVDNNGKIVGVDRPGEEFSDDELFQYGTVAEGEITKTETLETLATATLATSSANIVHGGYLYLIPKEGVDVYRMHLTTHVVSFVGSFSSSISGTHSINAIIGCDDNIYLAPYDATDFWRINTGASPSVQSLGSASGRYYECFCYGNYIVYSPNSVNYFAMYDTSTSTLTVNWGSSISATVAGFGSTGIQIGQYLYCAPYAASAQAFIKLDMSTGSWVQVGASLTTAAWKFPHSCLHDGKIYYVGRASPYDYFYVLDTDTDTYAYYGTSLGTVSSTSSSPLALAYNNGYVYLIPASTNYETLIRFNTKRRNWSVVFDDPDYPYPGPTSSPVTIDGEVYFIANNYGYDLFKYDLSNGNLKVVEKPYGFGDTIDDVAIAMTVNGESLYIVERTDGGSIYKLGDPEYSSTEYSNGFADIDELSGGYLFSYDGNYTGDPIGDTDYKKDIAAKAVATFRGSSKRDLVDYIYNTYGVTSLIEFVDLSDVKVYLDTDITMREKRVMMKYLPVSAGSVATLETW